MDQAATAIPQIQCPPSLASFLAFINEGRRYIPYMYSSKQNTVYGHYDLINEIFLDDNGGSRGKTPSKVAKSLGEVHDIIFDILTCLQTEGGYRDTQLRLLVCNSLMMWKALVADFQLWKDTSKPPLYVIQQQRILLANKDILDKQVLIDQVQSFYFCIIQRSS
jgi:hypothetical protein